MHDNLDNPLIQTVCVNSAITNITFNYHWNWNDLPTAAAWSSNVLTISDLTYAVYL